MKDRRHTSFCQTRCPTLVCWPQTRFGSSLVILAFHEDDKIKWRMSSLTYFSTGLAQMEGCSSLQVCRKAEKRKNTRRAEKRKTLREHVNGLCQAVWLNEQSITKHWFQSVRTCLYSWATGRNTRLLSEKKPRHIIVHELLLWDGTAYL